MHISIKEIKISAISFHYKNLQKVEQQKQTIKITEEINEMENKGNREKSMKQNACSLNHRQ